MRRRITTGGNSEAERSAKVQNAIDEVFRRDAGLLRRLGEGVTGDESTGSSGKDAPEIAKRTVKKTAKK